MTEPTIPVTRSVREEALRRVHDALPSGWAVMPIGGIALNPLVTQPGAATKDVDLVIVLLDGKGVAIPTVQQITEGLGSVFATMRPRKDETSVAAILRLEAGPVLVELIRGRRPGKGGYFVPRTILLAAAKTARVEGHVLRLPAEALAFLKAWAAVDQDKLIANDKDKRAYHQGRASAFRRDVRRLLDAVLDREKREPNGRALSELLGVTGGSRANAVLRVLRENGWSGALDRAAGGTR